MNALKKYLPIALLLGFLALGLETFLESRPNPKNERVYKIVQQYSPYYMDRRFGGLQILSKEDPDFKEKPNNKELFKKFEGLEKKWGQKHLKIEGNSLIILDNNASQISSLTLQNQEELDFAYTYYGLKK